MDTLYSIFALIFTTHIMLLLNAVLQNTYIITRCADKESPLLITLAFSLSGAVIAIIGVLFVLPFQHFIPKLATFIPSLGALALIGFAYKFFTLARRPHSCMQSHDTKRTIWAVIIISFASPHAMIDITWISGMYQQYHNAFQAVPLALTIMGAFFASAFLWYGCIGTVSYTLGRKINLDKYHTTLHWISAIVLFLIAINMLVQVHTEWHGLDFHIFGDHNHDNHGIDTHNHHDDTHDNHNDDTHHTHEKHDHK